LHEIFDLRFFSSINSIYRALIPDIKPFHIYFIRIHRDINKKPNFASASGMPPFGGPLSLPQASKGSMRNW
jgi:hypothetical protein